jgi:hypothetical protein
VSESRDVTELGKNTDFVALRHITETRPLKGIDPELAHLLRLPSKSGPPESVTYVYEGPHPVRIPIMGTNGDKLGEFGDFDANTLTKFTKIRALDQQTGIIVCSWTLEVFTFSSGWRTYDAKEGFHLGLLNVAGAVLLDFRLASNDVDISCGDNGHRRFVSASFRPDLYDIDEGALIYLPGGVTFHHC